MTYIRLLDILSDFHEKFVFLRGFKIIGVILKSARLKGEIFS